MIAPIVSRLSRMLASTARPPVHHGLHRGRVVLAPSVNTESCGGGCCLAGMFRATHQDDLRDMAL